MFVRDGFGFEVCFEWNFSYVVIRKGLRVSYTLVFLGFLAFKLFERRVRRRFFSIFITLIAVMSYCFLFISFIACD